METGRLFRFLIKSRIPQIFFLKGQQYVPGKASNEHSPSRWQGGVKTYSRSSHDQSYLGSGSVKQNMIMGLVSLSLSCI